LLAGHNFHGETVTSDLAAQSGYCHSTHRKGYLDRFRKSKRNVRTYIYRAGNSHHGVAVTLSAMSGPSGIILALSGMHQEIKIAASHD
jgi:acetylornithine/succinyldiaminopimelate/putrescine aminotransferase